MTVATNSTSKIEIADVVAIVVSDIFKTSSGYVRSIRFLGDPEEGSSNPSLVLEVKARAATKAPITIATPASGF